MVSYTEQELLSLSSKKMVIYKITNLINNKVYIGQTRRTFNERYCGKGVAISRVYWSVRCNSHLHASIEKYGFNNFKVEIIEQCNTIEELNQREKYYIALYKCTDPKCGYNYCEGGGEGERKLSLPTKINKLLQRNKDTTEKQIYNYLKKIHKFNYNIYQLVDELGFMEIVVLFNNGEIKFYKSLSHFKKEKKIKIPIYKLHCLYKAREDTRFKGLYTVKEQKYQIFNTTDIDSLPSNVQVEIKKREERLKKNRERAKENEAAVELFKKKCEKHGEWTREVYEWGDKTVIVEGYDTTEEQWDIIEKEFLLDMERLYPSFYNKHLKGNDSHIKVKIFVKRNRKKIWNTIEC